MTNWRFLDELAVELDGAARHDLPPGTSTVLSDRVAAALSCENRRDLEDAQAALERFYLGRLSAAPPDAAAAARGDEDAPVPEKAAFGLGVVGFAHAVVARAASRRVDDDFERRLRSKPLERYVRLLIDAEMSGRELAERLGKDEAQISRNLTFLRRIGAVECRREGNRVVNFLTPAARALAGARNMGALGSDRRAGHVSAEVLKAINSHRRELPGLLRGSLILVAVGDRRRA